MESSCRVVSAICPAAWPSTVTTPEGLIADLPLRLVDDDRLAVDAEDRIALGGRDLALHVGGERAVARVADAAVGLRRQPAGPVHGDVEIAAAVADGAVAQVDRDLRDPGAGAEGAELLARLAIDQEHVAEGLAHRDVALEAGSRRVRQIVCDDILSDLRREHP